MKKILLTLLIALALAMPLSLAATITAGNSTYYATSQLSVSLLNQDPDPVAAGDVVELRVSVENYGQQPIGDLVLELIPSYPFLPLSGESLVRDVGTLSDSQTGANRQVLKFKARVDPQGSAGEYSLKLWSYERGERSTHVEQTIPVTVKNPENVQVIYVDKTVLVPGQVTPMTFTIDNVGKGELDHVQFSWTNADGVVLPVSGGAARYIDAIGIGQSVDLTYQVIASTNANPDLYPLTLTLTYDDTSGSGTDSFSTTAGIYVGGPTDFAVSFDSSSGGSTSLNIANTGANPASAVAVSIPQQQGWRVTGAKTAMIGSLAKGDYTIANFELSGHGQLTVDVDYTDTMGNRQTKAYEVEVNAASVAFNATAGGTGSFPGGGFAGRNRAPTTSVTTILLEILGAIIVIAGGIYGYYAWQRRKRK